MNSPWDHYEPLRDIVGPPLRAVARAKPTRGPSSLERPSKIGESEQGLRSHSMIMGESESSMTEEFSCSELWVTVLWQHGVLTIPILTLSYVTCMPWKSEGGRGGEPWANHWGGDEKCTSDYLCAYTVNIMFFQRMFSGKIRQHFLCTSSKILGITCADFPDQPCLFVQGGHFVNVKGNPFMIWWMNIQQCQHPLTNQTFGTNIILYV